MKRMLVFLCVLMFGSYYLVAQSVGIGTSTPNANAMLDITSSNKGILIPRVSHRGIEQMALENKGSALNQLVKRTLGIKLSQGNKYWYLPFNLESHTLLKTHVANKAELNNELLLAWLQKRNAVATILPAPPATVTTKTAAQHTAYNLSPKIFITQNYNL